jgi:hypothetical protein
MDTILRSLRDKGARNVEVHVEDDVEDDVEVQQLIAFLDESARHGFRTVRVVPGSAAESSCLRRAGVR